MELKIIAYLTIPYIYEVASTKCIDTVYQDIKYVTLGDIAVITDSTHHRVDKDKIIYFKISYANLGISYQIGKDPNKDYIKTKLNKFFKYTGKIYNREGLLKKIKLEKDNLISLELLDK